MQSDKKGALRRCFGMIDNQRMEISWKTTPEELRMIADFLERDGCRQVRVNWHHTLLIFVLDEPLEEAEESVVEIEGDTDGVIPS